jgi:hypothetical protein
VALPPPHRVGFSVAVALGVAELPGSPLPSPVTPG